MPTDDCIRCTKFLFSTRTVWALSIKSCTDQQPNTIS
jgi:hypothetical protein